MKLAIMQPYFLPYIGYFQLINAVDKFVILDDVNFIKKGWINRNRILFNQKEYLFTIPLEKISQNKLINEINLVIDTKWKDKLLKTISTAYRKSPMFVKVFPLVENIIRFENNHLSEYLFYSISKLCEYLRIGTHIIKTSSSYNTKQLKGKEKIIEISVRENATEYINPIGGIELYNKKDFMAKNIQLFFLKSNNIEYNQGGGLFMPWLSIIDVMMHNSIEEINCLLNQYSLVDNE